MSIKSKGLLFAFEDNQENPQTGAEVLDTLWQDKAILNSSAAEIQDYESSLVAVNQDAVALESISQTMRDALDQGGMTPAAVKLATVHVDKICSRLGVESVGLFPALEDYEGESSSILATEIAIEGLGSKIMSVLKSVYEAIKRMFMKIVYHIKNFNAMNKAAKFSVQLAQKSHKMNPTTKVLDANFEDRYLASVFTANEPVDFLSVTSSVAGLQNAMALITEYSEGLYTHVATLESTVERFAADANKYLVGTGSGPDIAEQTKFVDQIIVSALTLVTQVEKFVSKFGLVSSNNGKQTLDLDLHVSGKKIRTVIDRTTTPETVVMSIEKDASKVPGKLVNTLPPSLIDTALSKAEAICVMNDRLERSSSRIFDIQNRICKVMDICIKLAEHFDVAMADKSKGAKNIVSAAKADVMSMVHNCVTLFTKVPAVNAEAVTAIVHYVKKSIEHQE